MISINRALDLVFRTFILYLITLVVFRFMGKRSVGHLAPFDWAVLIIIGEVAGMPMEEEKIKIIQAAIPIVILGVLQFLLSYANTYWHWLDRTTQGVSTVIIKNGQLDKVQMRRERLSMGDIEVAMRSQGVTKLSDIKEARLEPTGKISIIKTSSAETATKEDIKNLDQAPGGEGNIGKDDLESVLERHFSRFKKELKEELHQELKQELKGLAKS